MVVLAVVAILGFAAYPWLSNFREVMVVKGAAEQTAAAVRLARQLAITQGSNHCIEFGPGGAAPHAVPDPPGRHLARRATGRSSPATTGRTSRTAGPPSRPGRLSIFDPIGNRILPGGPTSITFNVDTTPSACLSVDHRDAVRGRPGGRLLKRGRLMTGRTSAASPWSS